MESRAAVFQRSDLNLVLYQPEIAANFGAAIRVCACFGAGLHVIEPAGFPYKARDVARVAMDYGALTNPVRHASLSRFVDDRPAGTRLVLLTTKAETVYTEPAYRPGDIFLLGQESAGVPQAVHDMADLRVRIPLAPGARSLNVSVAGAVILAEARRQVPYPQEAD